MTEEARLAIAAKMAELGRMLTDAEIFELVGNAFVDYGDGFKTINCQKCFTLCSLEDRTWSYYCEECDEDIPYKPRQMTTGQLAVAIENCSRIGGENGHLKADRLLLDYIGSASVTKAFSGLTRWYS